MTTAPAVPDLRTAADVDGEGAVVPARPPLAPSPSLRRRLARGSLVFVALVLVILAVLITASVSFVNAGNRVIYRWQPAVSASQEVLADLVNQETGVRGYSLTRRRGSLQPFFRYRPVQRRDTARLEDLIGDDGEIRAELRVFEQRADDWYRGYALPVIREIGSGGTASTGRDDAGRARFDRIRSAAATLTVALEGRALGARAARNRDGSISAVALGLGVLLLVSVGLVLWRGLNVWVLRPVDRLRADTRAVASGDRTRPITPDGPSELVELGTDVETMRALIVDELARVERIGADLRRKGEELERSNADLQQFAYVASHDLSEPLRKVANFCQLLERQYADQLDDRARQYIGFAVDGAKRMQALINDLLALSRVGRSTEAFVAVDLGVALAHAQSALAERIESVDGRVDAPATLPTVQGDRSLLVSLLQNLVGNAVKYHREDVPPVVTVAAEPLADRSGWLITVSDNGIGIDDQYAEQIFAVFQRLHLRDQYGGTGIGLALCRRIVEFHGGHIWLDTVRSVSGSTFSFTLPEGGPRAEHVR